MNEIHNRDISWIDESSHVIAEVSAPSLGVGYELRHAVIIGKPILCLWRRQKTNRLSAMISGSEGIEIADYSILDEAKEKTRAFLERV